MQPRPWAVLIRPSCTSFVVLCGVPSPPWSLLTYNEQKSQSYDDTAEEKRVQRCIDADDNAPETLSKLYAEHGMLRSVCGVLVTHRHGFPHVLLLRRPDGTWKLYVSLWPPRPFEALLTVGALTLCVGSSVCALPGLVVVWTPAAAKLVG